MSPLRKVLLWMFSNPASPYVSYSVAVNAEHARHYLAHLNTSRSEHSVTMQHLLAGAIARVLLEYPAANSRVVGHRIIHCPSVGVSLPVSLLGHSGGQTQEVGIVIVPTVEKKTLVEICDAMRKDVNAERSGKSNTPFTKIMFQTATFVPQSILNRTLSTAIHMMNRPSVFPFLFNIAPASTLITNVGATLKSDGGMLTRAASAGLPSRTSIFATVWGVGPIQDEVVAINGKAEVKPMLPLNFWFDHRVMDGVLAAKILSRLSDILHDPASIFGEDGNRVVGFSK